MSSIIEAYDNNFSEELTKHLLGKLNILKKEFLDSYLDVSKQPDVH